MFPTIVPTAAPLNVIGYALSSDSILLQWNPPPPFFQNGMIRRYAINVSEVETMEESFHSTSELQFTFSSLHPFYYYNFTVAAITIAPGPSSPLIAVRTSPDGKYTGVGM